MTVKSSMSSLIFSHFLHCYQTSHQLCSASVWQCARRSRFIFFLVASFLDSSNRAKKQKKQKHFVSVSGGDIKIRHLLKKTPNVNKTDRMALNTQRRNLSGGTIDLFHYSITVFFFLPAVPDKKKNQKKIKARFVYFEGRQAARLKSEAKTSRPASRERNK